MLSMDIALDTLNYLDKEEDFIPWQAASSELNYISRMLTYTELNGAFKVVYQY